MTRKIILASPRGFCAGVVRAIETVKLTLQQHGKPVYVLHEIVHNKHVISELREQGAVFVEELSEIPADGICVFSAHGVSKQTEKIAAELRLRTVDATCPLVSSVHRVVERYHNKQFDIIIIGHHKHPEVEGTAGRVDGEVHVVSTVEEAERIVVKDPDKTVYVTQTTLSQENIAPIKEALIKRFPKISGQKSNICVATQNRQNAVKKLARETDVILVVGSRNSSNSNRLREVAVNNKTDAYLIDDFGDIELSWIEGKSNVGITAGASAPERLVRGVVQCLVKDKNVVVEEMKGKEEGVSFKPSILSE